MLKNYFKVAVRSMIRNKLYSLINILGLTVGMSTACLLFMYVHDELSFDSYHENAYRTYRVVEKLESIDNSTRHIGMTAPPLAETLKSEVPEVERVVNLYQFMGHLDFIKDGTRFAERAWAMTDSNFPKVFDVEFKHGDPETAFSEPMSIVLTESTAQKYFGNEMPIGKTLIVANIGDMKVTGVIKDFPQNSHLQLKVMVSNIRTDDSWKGYLKNWDRYGAVTYVVLHPGVNVEPLSDKFQNIADEHWKDNPARSGFYLQPIESIHFNSANIEFGFEEQKGEIFYIYLFSSIGIFILIIASINYMNLATAKSLQRAREIGLRKVVGARKSQLIVQFLSESTLLTILAFVFSIGLIDLLLPAFNDVTGKSFQFANLIFGEILIILFSISVLIGLISGSYPAIYLSNILPVESLKGEIRTGRKGIYLRKGLVIFQFTLSIIMIIATLVVYNQMNYIRNMEVGFEKENMMVIDINSGSVRRSFETMKSEFQKIPGVVDVASSSRVPGEWKRIVEVVAKSQINPNDSLQIYFMCFDEDMLQVYDLELLLGKNFSGNKLLDSTSVILNEEAVISLGLQSNPIGEQIRFSEVSGPLKVIGVVKNFHFQSLHQKIAPLVIGYWANPVTVIDYFTLKFSTDNLQELVKGATMVHETFDTATPIEYHFLDQQIDTFYEADKRAGDLFAIGAGLTIIIACMGLFGLASFLIQKRLKEVSVRKVLGASGLNLFFILSKSFITQIIIAFIIASPIAWLVMDNWLDYFAYKSSLGVGVFISAGIIALLVSLISISYRSFQAVLVNPADTLKSE